MSIKRQRLLNCYKCGVEHEASSEREICVRCKQELEKSWSSKKK
jgi:hypothetical protein